MTAVVEILRTCPRILDFARHSRRLATCRRPRRDRSGARRRRSHRRFRRRRLHFRLRRHLHRRRGALRRDAGAGSSRRAAPGSANRLRVHTKLVPDLSILRTIERRDVEAIIDRSLRRLKMERLDLVQFHWWDYAEPRWLDALRWLDDLRAKGKVRLIGGTNFDTSHVRAIIEAGIPLASMQVQYSVLDRRPENGLSALCRAHGVGLHLLRLGCGRFSLRSLARPAGASSAAREPIARQIQAHHRRFRRLDAISGASARAPPRRRPAGVRHCERGEPVRARSSRRRCGHCRRNLTRASRRQRRRRRAQADRSRPGGDRGGRQQSAEGRKATSTNSSATARGRHGSIMKYNLSAEPA